MIEGQLALTLDGQITDNVLRQRHDTGEYRSRVFTDRPDYADFDPPHKFMSIQSIVAKRLNERGDDRQ